MPRTWDEATFTAKLSAFIQLPDAVAALDLARQGDERAFEAIVKASVDYMEGPDGVAYREALRALATPELLARWLGRGVNERRTAALALTAREPAHVALIRKALADADDAVRAIARRSLRSWRRGDALHGLARELLAHGDARVRAEAAEILGGMADRADVDTLRDALAGETDARTRGHLTRAIERIG
jgi:hypothetical protein